jgi:two-component sensor histidine kinase
VSLKNAAEDLWSPILVIEDNPAQLKTMSDILEMEGLHPLGCRSGREALACCQQYDVHVAILDLRLPDLDGLEVLSRLKQQVPDMKVIIHTGYATLESAMEAINQEVFAYVQKMGNVEELLTHVHRAFHAHLAGYSAQLEQEVQKRTAELSAANDELRQEIVERARAEEQIKASLREKEVLLREISHRTKNNMQVISALLDLQSATLEDERLLKAFKDMQLRMLSIAMVHEKLYRSDLTTVNLKEYIADLALRLLAKYHIKPGQIVFTFDTETVLMVIDTAVPYGLMIHELLSNALKHAFPDGRKGEIVIALHVTNSGEKELCISDNGVGLPENFDLRQTKSLGFRLVTMIAEQQLQGTVTLSKREPGTAVLIRFKEPHYKKRI